MAKEGESVPQGENGYLFRPSGQVQRDVNFGEGEGETFRAFQVENDLLSRWGARDSSTDGGLEILV